MLTPMPLLSCAALDNQDPEGMETLIEVCTDFTSLDQTTTVHQPAEQVFTLEEDDEPEDMLAMMDHSQWTGQGVIEPNMPPCLQQMFTLARWMGYEMRPIARSCRDHSSGTRFPKNNGTSMGRSNPVTALGRRRLSW